MVGNDWARPLALAEAGVYLIENLALDEITRAGLTTFCFILLATK